MDAAEVVKTQQALAGLIATPVLTDKLLQKPPLRFLHDILLAIIKEHGLMRGLFDQDEIAWNENIANDKEAKAFFIAKAINFVSVANGADIQTRSAKVCAGQEPEKTNRLLQALATLIKQKIDTAVVEKRVKNGEGPEKLSLFTRSADFLTAKEDIQLTPATATASSAAPASTASSSQSVTKPTAKTADNSTRAPPTKATPAPTKPLAPVARKPEPIIVKKAINEPATSGKQNALEKEKEKSIPARTEAANEIDIRPGAAATVRPTTARRAPQRPPTANIASLQPAGMVRRNTFVKDKDESDAVGIGRGEESNEDIEAAPPVGLRFLADEADQPVSLGDVISFADSNNDNGGSEFGNGILDKGRGFDVQTNRVENGFSGQLVSHLQDTQKTFVEDNGYKEDEVTGNALNHQEMARFKKEVDELQSSLQRISRLSDILTTQMQVLPEHFEEMDKDRQRYLEEIRTLQQQIEEANKAEESEMDKLRRELSLQQEALFVIEEEIASTQYRIKEKASMHKKLVRLTTKK